MGGLMHRMDRSHGVNVGKDGWYLEPAIGSMGHAPGFSHSHSSKRRSLACQLVAADLRGSFLPWDGSYQRSLYVV